MKYKLFLPKLAFILALTLIMGSCKKDRTTVYVEDKKPVVNTSDVWTSSISDTDVVEKLKQELRPAAKEVSFYANGYTWSYVYVTNRFDMFIPGSGWKDASGNKVTGSIKAVIHFIDRPGKNILFNKPTQTDNKLLRTGGSYSIEFFKDGQPVTNDGYYYVNLYGINKSAYSLFEASDGTNWKEINDGISGRTDQPWADTSSGLDSMRGFMKDTMFKLGCNYKWVNCDFYLNNSSKAIKMKLELPADFGNKNTSVSVVDQVNDVVTTMFGNPSTKLFETAPNYFITEGIPVIVVVIAKIGTDYYYSEKSVTTKEDDLIQMTPVKKTKQEVMDLLNAL